MRPESRRLETHGLEIAAFKILKQLTTCNFIKLGINLTLTLGYTNALACIFLQSITTRSTSDLLMTEVNLVPLMLYFRVLKLFVMIYIYIDKNIIFVKVYIFIEYKTV